MTPLIGHALAACLLSGTAAASPPPSAPEVRRLLDRMVEAFGGRATVAAALGLAFESTGTRVIDGARPPIHVSARTLIVFPDQYRQTLNTPAGTTTTILRKSRGAMEVGGMTTGMDETQVAALSEALRLNPLALARRHAAGVLAASMAPGRTGDGEGIARVALEGGAEMTIERQSGRIAAVSYPGTFMGKPGTYVVRYADYREATGGVVYPYSAEAAFDGRPAYTSRLSAITVNPPHTESDFLTPWAQPRAGDEDR